MAQQGAAEKKDETQDENSALACAIRPDCGSNNLDSRVPLTLRCQGGWAPEAKETQNPAKLYGLKADEDGKVRGRLGFGRTAGWEDLRAGGSFQGSLRLSCLWQLLLCHWHASGAKS
ncbi:GD20748 [Drosophila simulans]|uniref:GD20748 n=1 Tax=Drosophila simulans TaxID=7240 RepID=B4QVW7_DROSI|nr:GD20748 [Drosophila simulans]